MAGAKCFPFQKFGAIFSDGSGGLRFCFSISARSSRGVTYTVVYTSYSTMPGLAPLAFQMFFTSVVSTATFAPVPALKVLE